MLLKKSSCIFVNVSSFMRPSYLLRSFLRRLFMRLSLILCRCDAEWWCRWLYNIVISSLAHCLEGRVFANDSGELGHTKDFKNATWYLIA